MKVLEKIFNSDKSTNQLLGLLTIYCFALLLFRAKITNSIHFFFLYWNLFLAIIPYAITSYLKSIPLGNQHKFKLCSLLLIWLAFLPNSFYIITDLIHLVHSNSPIIWLDIMIISTFAFVGFAFGILSLLAFEKTVKDNYATKKLKFIIPTICFLCGIGIYIGRILRFNSWDILVDPIQLTIEIMEAIFTSKSMLFSLHFGILIYFAYLFKKNITLKN